MEQNNFNNDNQNFNNNNPTEKPGYYTTQQNTQRMMYPQQNPNPRNKSRIGLGIVIGILITLVCGVLAFLVIGITGVLRPQTAVSSETDGTDSYQSKLNLIETYLDTYFMGEYDADAMETSIAKGMLEGTGDKYAEYYSPKEFAQLMESVSGNYSGIGVSVIMNDDGKIEVYKVFEGTPAYEAGIQIGDLIVEAAGVDTFETVDDLVVLVRGEEGTSVDLTVLRDGTEIPMSVERKDIQIPTIYSEMLEDRIGYISIAEFEKATVEQFNNALDSLEAENMEGLILDLRDCPGGDYDSVVAMSDRVLPEGVIISTKDKNGNVKSENSDEAHKLQVPCVVLVNKNSASAAELFTGALQDYEMATIVGTTTYGKGVVQSIFSLPDGSGMKFTTETYYTPKGRDINGIGITPDVTVEIPEEALEDGIIEKEEDTQLNKAIEILTVR